MAEEFGVSLDEELQRFDLNRQQLNFPCSSEDCNKVARILVDWEPLAPFIGLEDTEITAIQREHPVPPLKYRGQCAAAIAKWKSKYGRRATFLRLAQGLEDIQDLNRVEKLCEIFKARRTSSECSVLYGLDVMNPLACIVLVPWDVASCHI